MVAISCRFLHFKVYYRVKTRDIFWIRDRVYLFYQEEMRLICERHEIDLRKMDLVWEGIDLREMDLVWEEIDLRNGLGLRRN